MNNEFDRPSAWRRYVVMFLLTLLVGIPLLVGGWAWITLRFAYSRGERAGYIQKISQKGWICKTWEGELAMANLPGAMPQIFQFTVRDANVAHQLEQNAGRQVSLSYEQHRGVPTSCFGETEYYITKVTPTTNNSQAPVQSPAVSPASK
jgi:hypothetical protein